MKRRILALSILLLPLVSFADERPVKFEQLPTKAQELVLQHFGELTLSGAKYDNDMGDHIYDIIFTDGTKIEFGRRGEWEKIECRRQTYVPEALLPTAMVKHITTYYGNEKVVEIERNINSFEVKLSNGIEMIFDSSGAFRRYED